MDNYDGKIVIGTTLSTKELESQLKDEERKLKNYEKQNEVLINTKVKIEKSKAMKEYQQLKDAIERTYTTKIDFTIGEEEESLRQKYRARQQQELQKLNEAYSEQFSKLKDINKQLEENAMHQELIKGKIETINKDLNKSKGYENIKNHLDDIGNGTEKVLKKITRWGLAIFGIRSAYMMIRQSMNTLSQYDEQMAVNIEYIRYLLATTLKPIIETIINLVYTLLTYLNYITQAWFGINLFANASTKEFQKQNKALGNSVKQAKELKNQLAGFDEANVLQDNTSNNGGTGTGSASKLPKFNEVKIPKWLEFLVKNKKVILALISGLVAGITALKLGLTGIQALGIGVAIAGLVYTIEKIIDFINDPSFENFTGVLEGIAIAVGGVAIAFGAWPVAIGAVVALVVIEIVKHFEEIKALFTKVIDWMDTKFLGKLKEIFGPIGNLIYMPFEVAIKSVKTLFESFYGGIKQIIEGIVKIFNGDFKGGIADILKGFGDVLLAPFNALITGVETVVKRLKTFFSDLLTWFKDKFISPFTSKLNGIISKLKEILGLQQKTNVTSGGGKGGFGGGTSGGRAKGGIFYPSKLPRLAVGGIINNPGMGVAYNGAVIGERGAEAVVPLTDSQQMSLLGETIGRYITINATIVNQMNGRVISKELQQIQSQEDFQFNG